MSLFGGVRKESIRKIMNELVRFDNKRFIF